MTASTLMLGHHEAILALQAAATVGMTGWSVAIGTRWYRLTSRRRTRPRAEVGRSGRRRAGSLPT